LKNANLYIFDEVTSYLDIKQRLEISKKIKNLADENTAVVIIEHDLIALDYMTDFVHIMYGSQGVFGVVSDNIPTKNGINLFLEGHLKKENIRFRDKKIKFDLQSLRNTVDDGIPVTWNSFSKDIGQFNLKAESGNLFKKQTIGVLGENGIGKTSFIKLLAGVQELGEAITDSSLKISYKPQYLNTTSQEQVISVITSVMEYENEIIKPLNLEPLFDKRLDELSGGELQKIAIAIALANESDIILLDEPSAYLDIEQRINISRIIRNIGERKEVTILVVDHDLLFLDYVSDKLIVFEGKPAINGVVKGPFQMKEGMNRILKYLDITLRKDEFSGRPRINKPNSVKDRNQKSLERYYYEK